MQTPAYSFPIEPHSLLPFAHWLPAGLRRRYWRLGAQGVWEDIDLLRRGELRALFARAASTPSASARWPSPGSAIRPVA